MPINSKVNGSIHEAHVLSVKVNGEWRQATQYTKINGEWKQVHSHNISSNDIIGFRMVYKRCDTNKKHDELSHLQVNYNLPIDFRLTGSFENMNTDPKGVIFEYWRDDPKSEGILMYEGRLFAVLSNGVLISISSDDNNQRVSPIIQGIDEYWNCNRLSNLSIDMHVTLQYETNGYYVAGWNGIFNNDHFIDQTDYTIKSSNKKQIEISQLKLTPVNTRDNRFNELSTIGIARDMSDPYHNMVGSFGYFDQTIHSITINGEKKPFIIEIYQ